MIDEGAYWRQLHDEMRAERDRYQQVAMDRTRERNEARTEAALLRARVQQLGEEGRRALHERDEARDERDRYRIREAQQRVERIKAEGEARRLRAALVPFAGLLAAYLDEPTGLDAIPTHVRLDDVREARRALGLD